MHLHETKRVPDRAIKSVANPVAFSEAQGSSGARMMGHLLPYREHAGFLPKARFSIVK
jgi:hypothetical protein